MCPGTRPFRPHRHRVGSWYLSYTRDGLLSTRSKNSKRKARGQHHELYRVHPGPRLHLRIPKGAGPLRVAPVPRAATAIPSLVSPTTITAFATASALATACSRGLTGSLGPAALALHLTLGKGDPNLGATRIRGRSLLKLGSRPHCSRTSKMWVSVHFRAMG